MPYIDSTEFERWAKVVQKRMLRGIYDQVRSDIIHFNEEVNLPINTGSDRWWQFTVTLRSLRVMASYELPGADEDPQIVGVASVDNASAAINAKPNTNDIEVGSTYPINLEVMKITDLKILPHSAQIVLKAIDDSDALTKAIIEEIRNIGGQIITGSSALIPYGSSASRVGSQALNDLLDAIGDPDEIGELYNLFYVRRRQFWRRTPNMHVWHKFKFVAFVEEDPDDEDTPYEEIYLTCWELKLESEQALTGEASNTDGEKSGAKKVSEPKEETGKKVEKPSKKTISKSKDELVEDR